MKFNETIFIELQQISPLLASLPKENIFELPDGYFEELQQLLLGRIKIPDNNRLNMDVPAGYFDTLSANIISKINADAQETKSLERTITSTNIFSVPDGYFNAFAQEVINKISVQKSANAIEEIKQISPLLFDLRQQQPFELPLNYFDDLSTRLLLGNKTKPTKLTQIIPLQPLLKYAIAAMLIAMLAAALVYKLTNNFSIINYNTTDNASAIPSLDSTVENGKNMSATQLEEAITNLSADDISNYLERNSSEEDIATLTNTIEEDVLPNKADYLTDDKTLDKYLNTIESNN